MGGIYANSGRAAQTYGRAMRLALRVDPARVVALFGSFDRNIPDEQYEQAFQPSDENWLLRSTTTDDPDGLTAVFEVATRLRAAHLQRDTSARLLQVLARGRDTARLVAFLMRLRHLELIESDALAELLKDVLRHSSFGRDAARWTDTVERKSLALRCCLGSPRLADVDAALRLAEELSDRAALRVARERLGRLSDALETCPSDAPDRLVYLAEVCHREINAASRCEPRRWCGRPGIGTGPTSSSARRGRLEAYRPSAADPDPTTRTVLAEMFNTGHEVESELLAVELALHDLAANVRTHFDRPDHDSGVAAAQNLCEQLRANLNRYRGLSDTIARWNAVLVRVAVAQTDPVGSFLTWHEAGDYARALDAVAHVSVPLADFQHVRRHLDCLAHVGDSAGYENLLREHAGRFGAVPVDVVDPVAFLTRARSSTASTS